MPTLSPTDWRIQVKILKNSVAAMFDKKDHILSITILMLNVL